MSTPPKRDLIPMHSWTQRRPLRRIILSRPSYGVWPLELPSAVSGTGKEEKKSGWMTVPKPYPYGEGLFSMPSVRLRLEQGGALHADAEFWGPAIYLEGAGDPSGGCDGDYFLNTDAMEYWGPKGEDTEGSWENTGPTSLPQPGTGKEWLFGRGEPSSSLGENGDYYFDRQNHAYYGPKAAGAWGNKISLPDPGDALIDAPDLENLSALEELSYSDYGLFSLLQVSSPLGETGTWYSDYVACGPIPAGSGILIGSTGIYGAGGGALLQTVAREFDGASGTASGSLQLCDKNEGLITSISLESHTMKFGDKGNSLSLSQSTGLNKSCSWGGEIAKVRAKIEVTEASDSDTGFVVWQMSLRRFA